MPESRDIRAVVAVVSNPIGKGDTGEVVEGFYTRDGDTLTMTDREGNPLRDDNNGERITVRLTSRPTHCEPEQVDPQSTQAPRSRVTYPARLHRTLGRAASLLAAACRRLIVASGNCAG
jgi:hypothetical protein